MVRFAAAVSAVSDLPSPVPNVAQDGVFKQILSELAKDLYERGAIDIREAFIDDSLTPAKKGAILPAIQSAAKAPLSWQLQTILVFLSPLSYKTLHPVK